MHKTTVISVWQAPRGWENSPDYVYIGRAGKGQDGYFGNPIRLEENESRGSTIERFHAYAQMRAISDPVYADRVRGLKGKVLVCFCKPNACHGDVLADMAEGMAS